MSLAFQGGNFGSDNSGVTAFAVDLPSHDSGDLLIIAIALKGTGVDAKTITPPSGWALQSSRIDNGSTLSLAVYAKVSDGSEGSNATFTFGGTVYPSAITLAWRGQSSSSPINVASGQTTSFGTSHATPSGTTGFDDCDVIGIWAGNQGMAFTVPGSMTQVANIAGSGTANAGTTAIAAARAVQSSAGSTGAKTATANFSTPGVTFILAIKPAQVPSAPGTPSITGDVSGTTTDRNAGIGWTAATDADTSSGLLTYEGQLSTDNGSNWSALFTTPAGQVSTTADFTNKTATTTAKVRVRAIDPDGNTGAWATSSAFTIQHAPNAPVLLTPDAAGIIITVGTTYAITWSTPTDPNSTTGQIVTIVDQSANGGSSWTNITTTSGGATSANWNTTGLTPGTNYKVRIQHRDETSLVSAVDISANAFEIRADATPSAPASPHAEQPASTTVTVADLAQTIRIAYTFQDAGDVQSAHRFEWGTDGVSYPNDSGFLSTANQYKDYAGATFSAGTVYFRITTKDHAGNTSPAATFNFTVAAKPSTPNISAPTAASPATTARPTAAWTSSGQSAYQLLIRLGSTTGTILYDSGTVSSASTSHNTAASANGGVDLANGVQYTFQLRIRNSAGLWSDYDSETFTATYTGPGQPVLTVTPQASQGRIKLEVANPDTPTRNEIWMYESAAGSATAIRVKTSVLVDGTFYYRYPASGKALVFFARAVDSNGLVTDSAHSSAVSITLSTLWLASVDDADTVVPLELNNTDISREAAYSVATFEADGRELPFAEFGQIRRESHTFTVYCPLAETDFNDLQALADQMTTLCVRDGRGRKAFCVLERLPNTEPVRGQEVQLTFDRVGYYPSGIPTLAEEEV